MKKAEEWLVTMFDSPETTTHTFKQHIEAIQLDTFKATMRYAAKIIGNKNAPDDCQTCLAVASESILFASNATELPKELYNPPSVNEGF